MSMFRSLLSNKSQRNDMCKNISQMNSVLLWSNMLNVIFFSRDRCFKGKYLSGRAQTP
jgi:hypothetical protein